jgi:hypothetical protein
VGNQSRDDSHGKVQRSTPSGSNDHKRGSGNQLNHITTLAGDKCAGVESPSGKTLVCFRDYGPAAGLIEVAFAQTRFGSPHPTLFASTIDFVALIVGRCPFFPTSGPPAPSTGSSRLRGWEVSRRSPLVTNLRPDRIACTAFRGQVRLRMILEDRVTIRGYGSTRRSRRLRGGYQTAIGGSKESMEG